MIDGYLVTCENCYLIESFLDRKPAKRFAIEMDSEGHHTKVKEVEFDE